MIICAANGMTVQPAAMGRDSNTQHSQLAILAVKEKICFRADDSTSQKKETRTLKKCSQGNICSSYVAISPAICYDEPKMTQKP